MKLIEDYQRCDPLGWETDLTQPAQPWLQVHSRAQTPVHFEARQSEEVLLRLFRQLSQAALTRWPEVVGIAALEREVSWLRERVRSLENASPRFAIIQTFEPEPFEVITPVTVSLRSNEDEFVATFHDANLSASGSTEEDAVMNLKDLMVSTFEILSDHKPGQLGSAVLHQLRVLRTFIRKKR